MKLNLINKLNSKFEGCSELLNQYPSRHYKVYKIPKKTIGFRTIAQPTPQVKKIQTYIVKLLSELVQPHHAASAYIEGRGIKEHAEKHKGSEYLLKVDFRDFFNSITPDLLHEALINRGINLKKSEILYLSEFLFWNRARKRNTNYVLSVGAPSSPYISNIIMFEFDRLMDDYCNENDVLYSRYADDLVLSTSLAGVLAEVIKFIPELLSKCFHHKLTINHDKTVFSSKGHNRHITGITIANNNTLSIGRHKKKYISALIHKYISNSLSSSDIYHLKGLISFATHIEPKFIYRLEKRYGTAALHSIKYFDGATK
ncbi:retron St85 family RNA-directed DNA polymerase [Pseudoalteromonas sp. APC 3691]|uniref:retron St85 family RNA-directed DNA polymerase n=1 Tax=Pseudoalteromonas sp. APC 3691 TaxID=3035173 RepID=UPI0025B2B2B9|nr:retron St85 family RNA-directed DNA polymerase [Pseudoalteromonas sp. APC 3691]MDN3391156.1 retron St85 family RNA-directed DNA polymerase [Pseudoalteromonas sp. APC 3691]